MGFQTNLAMARVPGGALRRVPSTSRPIPRRRAVGSTISQCTTGRAECGSPRMASVTLPTSCFGAPVAISHSCSANHIRVGSHHQWLMNSCKKSSRVHCRTPIRCRANARWRRSKQVIDIAVCFERPDGQATDRQRIRAGDQAICEAGEPGPSVHSVSFIAELRWIPSSAVS